MKHDTHESQILVKSVLTLFALVTGSSFPKLASANLLCKNLFETDSSKSESSRQSIQTEINGDLTDPSIARYLPFLKIAQNSFPIEVSTIFRELSPYIFIPPRTSLIIEPGLGANRTGLDSTAIEIGVIYGTTIVTQKRETRVYSKHPKYILPILRHEVGHLILNENLIKNIPEIAEYVKFYRPAQRDLFQADQAQREIDFLKMPGMESLAAEIPRLEIELEKIDRVALEKISRKYRPIDNLVRSQLAPYQEFFADLVAIVFSKDPNAVAKSLFLLRPLSHVTSLDKDGAGAQRKAIREDQLANDLRAFRRNVRKNRVSSDDHGALWKVRQHVWDEYLRSTEGIERNGIKLIVSATNAIIKEAFWLMENPSFAPMEAQDKVTERLIEAIDFEMSRILASPR